MGGFSEEYVSRCSVEEFGELYASVMRIKSREQMELLVLMQNAYHGDKRSLSSYMKTLKSWLPSFERNGARGDAKGFERALKGNKK